MPTYVIGLFVALGGGAWVFSKLQRTTGGQTQTSLLFAGIAGFILFLFTIIVFGFLPE